MITFNVPWDSGYQILKGTATAEAAIKQVGLDWAVTKEPVQMWAPKAKLHKITPNKYNTMRSDTEEALGVVGSVYTPLQNLEAFGFMDEIVKAGAANYKWAGQLRGGRKVYVLVDLNMKQEIQPGDTVESYLLLMNGHDGLTKLDIGEVYLRNKTNSFTYGRMSKTEKGQFYTFKHTSQLKARVGNMSAALKVVRDKFVQYVQGAKLLANHKLESGELDAFLLRVEHLAEASAAAQADFRVSDKYKYIANNYHELGGSNMWNAFGGIGIYVDHQSRTRRTKDHSTIKQDNRFSNAIMGSGAQYKDRAFKVAHNMANNKFVVEEHIEEEHNE